MRDGSPVVLTPKAFDTLCVLVERHGRLVPAQELIEMLWPDTFVEPNNLAQQVSALRRALGDGAGGIRYVETVPRRGYRFTAAVVRHDDDRAHGDARRDGTDTGGVDPLTEGGFTRPHTQYARSGDTSIAYQVIGDGPIDIVFVMGWVSHLDSFWDEPSFARFLTRLASFSRLILFDKRGTGLSDRVTALPSLEQRMDDVRAVMDAVGSTRAALLGVSEGGPMCSLFAATYPDKTLALVMIGTYAKRVHAPDYPWAPTPAQRDAFYDEIRARWGEPIGIEDRAPSRQSDPAFRQWWATYLRNGASPGAALALTQMNTRIDVREVLPNIRVPTLILHRVGDRCLRIEEGRYVASRIPGARLMELPGDDHLPFVGNQDDIVHPIEAFLTGFHPGSAYEEVLATALVAQVDDLPGDGEIRERFQAFARREVTHFRGVGFEVADGRVRAAFDGPARAVRCAAALVLTARRLGIPMRAALDLGQCAVTDAGVSGPAVTRATDLGAALPFDTVAVSPAVHDLVAGAGLSFTDESPTHDAQGAHVYIVDLEALLTPGREAG